MTVIIRSDPFDTVSLAVVRSLGKKKIDLTVISKKERTIAQYSKFCGNSIISLNDLEIFSQLSQNDIVYPMDESLMLQLSEKKKKLQCSLAFSDYHTLEKVVNKSRLLHHAIEHDIPCPETVFIDKPEDIRDFSASPDFPLVLKPSVGSGGKGIMFINSFSEFAQVGTQFFEKYGSYMIQEKIPFTQKYTVGVLCNKDSEVRRACVIRELRNYPGNTGPACYVETVHYPELLNISIKLMESLNYFGIADIDFLIDTRTGKPTLMEINPRFWGSIQVAINAGVDFPSLLFYLMKNGDIKKSFDYKTGIRCRHLIFDDINRLLSTLRGRYVLSYKIKSITDFLTLHPEDGYYVFSLDDLKPFQHLIRKKILKSFWERTH